MGQEKFNENYSRTLIEASNDPMLVVAPEGNIADLNRAFAEAVGLPREEIVGSECSRYFSEPEKIKSGCSRLFEEERLEDYEVGLKLKNGQILPVLCNASLFRDRNGEIAGAFTILRDISSLKAAEARLAFEVKRGEILLELYQQASLLSEQELYDYALNKAVELTQSEIGFLHRVSDDQREILLTTWNRKACETCTAAPDDHYPLDKAGNWTDCVKEKRPVIYNDYSSSPNQKGLPEGHSPLKRLLTVPVLEEDKVRIIFGVGNKPAPYDQNDELQIQLVANELQKIIRQRTYEQNLQDSEKRYRLLFESANEGIALEKDGKFVDLNPRACRILGGSRENFLGKSPGEISPEKQPDGQDSIIKAQEKAKSALGGEPQFFEWQAKKINGELIDAEINLNRLELDGYPYILAIIRDITPRKNYEKALKQALDYNRSLLEASPDPLVTIDPEGKITDVNQATEKATGFPRKELIGNDFSDYFTDPQKAQAGYCQVFQEGSVKDYELDIKHKDGGAMPVLYNATVYRNENGEVAGIFADARDITQQKIAENELLKAKDELEERVRERTLELKAQKDELQIIFDSVPALIFYKDKENRFLRNNLAMEKFHGIPREQLEGRSLFELFERDDAEAYWRDDLEVINSEKPKFGIVEKITTELGEKTITVDKLPYRNREGQITGVLGFGRDITEQIKAENARLESEEKLRLILTSTASGIYGLDLEGRCTFCNQAALTMLGYQTPEELLGKKMHSLIHHAHEDGSPLPVEECRIHQAFLQGQGIHAADEVYWRSDGKSFPIEYWSYPQFKDGKVVGAVVAFNDITERKAAETQIVDLNRDLAQRNRALETANQELETANKELESFSYSVSHDLRSPLVGIDGFSQLLLRDYADKLDEKGKGYLERVRGACLKMSNLIDSILQLSRISRAELNLETVNLSALAEAVAEDLKSKDPARQVEWVIAPDLKAEGDKQLLERVLTNLLSNAWKFTSQHPQARIEFGSTVIEGRTVYFVKDDGSGFDMAYKDQLFMPFRRLHSAREFPGTGVGLSIIQRVMNRHGGRVWAEAEVEKGATFYLEFKGENHE